MLAALASRRLARFRAESHSKSRRNCKGAGGRESAREVVERTLRHIAGDPREILRGLTATQDDVKRKKAQPVRMTSKGKRHGDQADVGTNFARTPISGSARG
jgi:hypothetical protein